jgi:[acyl-carrier-protein] S-malonyltransferase
MAIAFVFPGQGAQFVGMGKNIYEQSEQAKKYFADANEILGFNITSIMFEGTDEDLKQTKVTQPAIFLHSVIAHATLATQTPAMVAGHSLGEFSALVANKVLSFKTALELVAIRANAMQKACEAQKSTMAAILGLDDSLVEQICASIPNQQAVPANYNCPGQLVISGSVEGVEEACKLLKEAGAKRALLLPVGGAFHSKFMQPAQEELQKAIEAIEFKTPICPVYQNVNAEAVTNPQIIKKNLVAQLTAPVRWTQTIKAMEINGATNFTEFGPGKVLQGLVGKIFKEAQVNGLG